MKVKKLLIPLSFLLLLPATQAQTLKEVVRGTLISNPEIQALRANTKAYRYYVDEEKGKLYPSINLETFFEELNTERDNQADERKSGINTQIKLEQTLFDGWLTPSKIQEAKKDLKATQYRNSATIEGVVLDAVDAYLNVVKNEEFRLLSENNLLIHEDYLQVASESEDVSGDTLDRMQVESKIFSANAKFSEVKRDALQAKATLEKLYGKKIDNDFCRPIIKDHDNFNDLQGLISQALTVNYSVLEEINRIKTQRAIVSQEKSRFYPTITAKLLREVDDGVDTKDVKKTEDSFRITLSYNLFNGGQDAAILEREKIFLKESQKTLDDVVNSTIEEIKINYTKFHTAKKRIVYLQNYLAKNKDILIVYLEQFEGGTRGFIDILNHEAELFRAKTDLIQEQFTYTLAYYELQNLLSNLSSTVLSTDKQVCEEIKVDVERRQLSSTEDETETDEELAAIFEEGEASALNESGENANEQKVQSMLNKILNDIYDPNAVNRNINVSQLSHSVTGQELLPEGDPQDEVLKELIKIQQELEEQALRNEQNQLKTQMKDAAKTLAKQTVEKETVKKEELVSSKKKEVVPEKDIQKQKEEAQKIREAAIQKAEALKQKDSSKAAKSIDKKETKINESKKNKSNETEKELEPKKKSKVLHEFNDEKLLSLEQRQAISRALGEKFKQLFRKEHGLDENGYEKLIEKTKPKTKEEAIKELTNSFEQKPAKVIEEKTESKSEEKKNDSNKDEMVKESTAENKLKAIEEQKANAQKIREAALKNAQALKEKQLNAKKDATANVEVVKEEPIPQFRKDENVKMIEDKIAQNKKQLEKSKETIQQSKELVAVKQTQAMISKYSGKSDQKQKVETQKVIEEKAKAKVEAKENTAKLETKAVQENKAIEEKKEEVKETEVKSEVVKPELSLEQQQAQSRILEEKYKKEFRQKEGLDDLGYSKALQEKAELEKVKEKIEAKVEEKENTPEVETKAVQENKVLEEKKEEVQEKEVKSEVVKPELSLAQQQAQSRILEEKYKKEFRQKEGLDDLGYSKALKEKILKETLEAAKKEKERILKEAKLNEQEQKKILTEQKLTKEEILEDARRKQEAKKAKIDKILNLDTSNDEIEIEESKDEKTLTASEINKSNTTAQEVENELKTQPETKINLDKLKAAKIREQALKQAEAFKEKQQKIEIKTANEPKEVKTQVDDATEKTVASSSKAVNKPKKIVEEVSYEENSLTTEFLGKKSKKYTLAILTLSKKQEPEFIKKRYDLEETPVIYKLKNDGKTYYKVIYGLYDSAKEAKADIKNLHKTLRKNGAFVNKIATHQKLFKKYNKDTVIMKNVQKVQANEVKEKQSVTKTSDIKKQTENDLKIEEKTPLIKNRLKSELIGPKSKKYTLGLLTLSVPRKPDFIKKHYNLEKNIIIYKSQNNGKVYFKVIYGVYDSVDEAKADIKNLHKTLQKQGVFVNRISTHQKLFKKYNPNGEL